MSKRIKNFSLQPKCKSDLLFIAKLLSTGYSVAQGYRVLIAPYEQKDEALANAAVGLLVTWGLYALLEDSVC